MTPLRAGDVLAGGWRALRASASIVVPIVIAFELPIVVLQLWLDEPLPFEAAALWGLVTLIGDGTVYLLASRALRGQRLDARAALRDAARAYARIFVTELVGELLVLMFLLLLVVPGVLRALSYSIAVPIALHEGRMGRDACDVSADRTRGSRVAIAIALVPAWFLALGAQATVLVVPHEGAGPLATAALDLAIPLTLLPGILLSAAIYERTRPEPAEAPEVTPRRDIERARGRARARSPRRGRG